MLKKGYANHCLKCTDAISEVNMSEIGDAKDFVNRVQYAEKTEKKSTPSSPKGEKALTTSSESNEVAIESGQVSQYAYYRRGYAATSKTIETLPSGRYDILADNKCTYVMPMLKPSGILFDLPEMRSDDVIKIVQTFLDSEKDYKEGNDFVLGGARYTTGIMMFGVAGSGKSCTIQIVNKKLIELGGIVFYANISPGYVMTWFNHFSRIEPNRKSVVILEDIDTLIETYGESDYLAMLDSTQALNNVLFIATTNYPEKLDPRIYNRPGRFSHVIKVGLPTPAAREAYLKAILKNHRDVNYIVENTDGFTIDHLNALVNAVYREKKNMEDEIERLRLLWKVPKANEKSMGIGIGK